MHSVYIRTRQSNELASWKRALATQGSCALNCWIHIQPHPEDPWAEAKHQTALTAELLLRKRDA